MLERNTLTIAPNINHANPEETFNSFITLSEESKAIILKKTIYALQKKLPAQTILNFALTWRDKTTIHTWLINHNPTDVFMATLHKNTKEFEVFEPAHEEHQNILQLKTDRNKKYKNFLILLRDGLPQAVDKVDFFDEVEKIIIHNAVSTKYNVNEKLHHLAVNKQVQLLNATLSISDADLQALIQKQINKQRQRQQVALKKEKNRAINLFYECLDDLSQLDNKIKTANTYTAKLKIAKNIAGHCLVIIGKLDICQSHFDAAQCPDDLHLIQAKSYIANLKQLWKYYESLTTKKVITPIPPHSPPFLPRPKSHDLTITVADNQRRTHHQHQQRNTTVNSDLIVHQQLKVFTENMIATKRNSESTLAKAHALHNAAMIAEERKNYLSASFDYHLAYQHANQAKKEIDTAQSAVDEWHKVNLAANLRISPKYLRDTKATLRNADMKVTAILTGTKPNITKITNKVFVERSSNDLMILLLTQKADMVSATTTSMINEVRANRVKLTDELINYVKKIPDSNEKLQLIHSVIDKQNALGIVLNTPVSSFRFAFTARYFENAKITGSIDRIIREFEEIAPRFRLR